jgi:hypothetical protein
MSTVNINDMQSVPLNQIVQTQQANNDVTIYPPPPSYTHIRTQALQDPHQYQTMTSPIYRNNELISVTVTHDPRYDDYPISEKIVDVHEYTLWSIFNTIFCCVVIGGCALNLSCKTRQNKRRADLISARNTSKFAAIFNIVATLCGILFISLGILRYTGHIVI